MAVSLDPSRVAFVAVGFRTSIPGDPVLHGLLLGLGVMAFCLAGILTRDHLDLATFWPANAFLLGMLVRFPHLARSSSWLWAAAGYGLADMAAGTPLLTNLMLNGCNLVAVATGYVLFARLSPQDRALRRPASILYFLGAVIGAALAGGLVGTVINPVLFGGSPGEGFAFWFAAELVNYTAFLPMLLTLPESGGPAAPGVRGLAWRIDPARALPLLALVASIVAGLVIGGPGAVAFPVPALLWCALTYNLFVTSCLAFAFGAWTLVSIQAGVLAVGTELESRAMLISTRVGVTLVALGPLVVASVMAARDELLDRLRILADRDAMTGLQNRRSFLEAGAAIVRRAAAGRTPVAVMMLDIDHFKSINDRHGHEAGDHILLSFAEILERNVRPQDAVGRIGGEEFAIVLPDCGADEAVQVAERINGLLHASAFVVGEGEALTATVSIGVHVDRDERRLERLLCLADKALYRAKHGGRNRLELSVAPAHA